MSALAEQLRPLTDCELFQHPHVDNSGRCPCGHRVHEVPNPVAFIFDPWVWNYDPRHTRPRWLYGLRKAGPRRVKRERRAPWVPVPRPHRQVYP